jgi:hypothetical protein
LTKIIEIAERIAKDVAELSDRTSPDDWPEAMLVTADELILICERNISLALKPETGTENALSDKSEEA